MSNNIIHVFASHTLTETYPSMCLHSTKVTLCVRQLVFFGKSNSLSP